MRVLVLIGVLAIRCAVGVESRVFGSGLLH